MTRERLNIEITRTRADAVYAAKRGHYELAIWFENKVTKLMSQKADTLY